VPWPAGANFQMSGSWRRFVDWRAGRPHPRWRGL